MNLRKNLKILEAAQLRTKLWARGNKGDWFFWLDKRRTISNITPEDLYWERYEGLVNEHYGKIHKKHV